MQMLKSVFNLGYQLWDRTIGRLLVLTLVGLIRIYQNTISVWRGPVCRYYPTCSHYGLGAIQVHGAGKGILLTAWRVLRCNPWSSGGIDQVPTRGHWTSASTESEVIEFSTKLNRQVIA